MGDLDQPIHFFAGDEIFQTVEEGWVMKLKEAQAVA